MDSTAESAEFTAEYWGAGFPSSFNPRMLARIDPFDFSRIALFAASHHSTRHSLIPVFYLRLIILEANRRQFCSPTAFPSEHNDSFFSARLFSSTHGSSSRLSWKLSATDLKLCWNLTLTAKLALVNSYWKLRLPLQLSQQFAHLALIPRCVGRGK